MFDDVCIMMSSDNSKIHEFTKILDKYRIKFKTQNICENKQNYKYIFVSFFKQKKAKKLFEEFNHRYHH